MGIRIARLLPNRSEFSRKRAEQLDGYLNLQSSSPLVLRPSNPSVARVRFDKQLQQMKGRWIVWWYGALSKNRQEGTIPLNSVLFRELLPDNTLGQVARVPAAMTHLGNLRFGSVWSGGVSVGNLALAYLAQRTVSFSRGDWNLVSAEDVGLVRLLNLHYADRRSMLVELKSADDLTILVPCTEFFVRGYGRSTETIRTLLRSPWKEAKKRFFFDDEDNASNSVRLNHHVRSSEAVLLHHALYDDYTKSIIERLYKDLRVGFDKQKNREGSLPCLNTGPWFEGSALIEGKGIWIDAETFLMLDVKGMSEPAGDLIVIERQGTDATGGMAGERIYTKSAKDIPIDQQLDLIDSAAPDSNVATIFYDPPFKRLGKKRRRMTVRTKIPGKRGIALPGQNNHQPLSTGDARGSGKGIGKGEGNAPEHVLHGALAQMWKSCTGLGTKYPTSIAKVEWFTFADEFVEGGTPEFEPLRPHISEKDIPIGIKDWTYMRQKPRILRGALIIRLTCHTRTFYLFETQRNRPLGEASESASPDKERYRGLIVELPNNGDAAMDEIRLILKAVCLHMGRIYKQTMSQYPHTTFDHHRNAPPIIFENVLVSKLQQLGMFLE